MQKHNISLMAPAGNFESMRAAIQGGADAVYFGIEQLNMRARSPEYVKTVTRVYKEAIEAVHNGSFSPEKVAQWTTTVEKVYNRGFWDGYYMGKKLGEWTDTYGSQATTKKIFLGKGVHYFSKLQVGEFKIESHQLKEGDKS